jgi:hypothetical protein
MTLRDLTTLVLIGCVACGDAGGGADTTGEPQTSTATTTATTTTTNATTDPTTSSTGVDLDTGAALTTGPEPTTSSDVTTGTTAGPDTGTDASSDTSGDNSTGSGAGCGEQGANYEVSFATYHGGSDWEHTRDVAIDAEGFIYVAGGTASDDLPVTPGAYDTSFNTGGNKIGQHGASDVYVAKYTPDGQLVWATYLGGPNYDRAYALEIDPAGDVLISGRAGPGFPTTPGVFQPEYKGNGGGFYGVQGGFVAKLSADGSTLKWSSNVGVGQLCRDFAVDAAGDLYVKMGTTPTSPLNNPPAWFAAGFKGAYQPVPADADDAGLVKIRNDGSEVVWATWIGGKGIDSQPGSVRVDPAGSPYMLFYTDASDLKTTPGAHDASHNGGKDLFLAKFSPDGAKLLLGTYLGGSGDDTLETHALSLDAAGNIYAMAITGSNDFPTTPGAFQESFGGKADVAVAKFDPSGKFLAATYVGGSGGEGPDGLSVSADGEVLFVGETNSTDFPVTPDAFQSKHGGDFDIYAARLSGDLSSMVYGSYFGGSGHDNGRGALFGDDCALYLVGASDGGFPVKNAWQPVYGGGVDMWGNGDNVVIKLVPGP